MSSSFVNDLFDAMLPSGFVYGPRTVAMAWQSGRERLFPASTLTKQRHQSRNVSRQKESMHDINTCWTPPHIKEKNSS